jgi:serine phosphatase RsbU (regulator of sigma subunit)
MTQYRIMIVDDSKFILSILSNLLKKNNYIVAAYSNAKIALNNIDDFNPHLILSDYNMPEMDGLEFCINIKNNQKTKDIKFLLITGVDDINSKVKCFEVGADDYILKPFNNREIIARIKTHITIKQLQDDLKTALKKIDEELEIVGKIQRALLPDKLPDFKNLQFSYYYNTYTKSGGDYFDFIDIDEENIGILIVDVSGHGTSSTVVMTMFKIFFSKVLNKVKNPAEVLNRLNKEMLQLLDIGKFATIFYGILNKNTLEMTFSNAAHPNPYIINKINKKTSEISGNKGLPCGILPFATGSYKNNKVILNSNDRVILYTDGILEARKDDTGIFGEERFLKIVTETSELPLDKAKEKIIGDVLAFSGNKLNDDITMLMFDVI